MTEIEKVITEYLMIDESSPTGLIWKKDRGCKLKAGSVVGCLHHSGYIKVKILGKALQAHRIIWFLAHGRWPMADIDHINGRRADNRISNLREATRSQNCQNKIAKGCQFVKKSNCWVSRINVNGEILHLGTFKTFEEANSVYLKAKAELHPFASHHVLCPQGVTE